MPTPTQKVACSSLAASVPFALSRAAVGATAATAAKSMSPARVSAPLGLTCASTIVLKRQQKQMGGVKVNVCIYTRPVFRWTLTCAATKVLKR